MHFDASLLVSRPPRAVRRRGPAEPIGLLLILIGSAVLWIGAFTGASAIIGAFHP